MEVLVVLGNKMNDDGSFSIEMMKRLTKTLEVVKNYDKVLCCGGIANTIAGVREADRMKEYLIENGVDESKIVIENNSTTTKENAKFSKEILEELGVREITLLSSKSHIRRCYLNPVLLFRKWAKVKVKATIKV
ncbi:MAG: YdcF family protein [Clostridia bacterium]|nr:YdcF family protein [Clostridia bacterium]